jgi:hypothetical protein
VKFDNKIYEVVKALKNKCWMDVALSGVDLTNIIVAPAILGDDLRNTWEWENKTFWRDYHV